MVTGKAFRIERIRAQRSRPGLQRQHLTAVLAAAEVGRAQVDGASLNSQSLAFAPGDVRPGHFRFATGSAGSAMLVLQTILPALVTADGPSEVELEGGTHNIYAPPFDFLALAFLPLLQRMGPRIEAVLHRPGFYPAGGGRVTVTVGPQERLAPLELVDRGRVVRRRVRGMVSRLPRHIAQREVDTALRKLGWPGDCGSIEELDSPGPGNAVIIEVHSEQVAEVFTGFGQRGVPAEKVASAAAREARGYLEADVPVGEHLADQLLLPMALAGGGSFRTTAPTEHTRTNAAVIRSFLEVDVRMQQESDTTWRIDVGRASSLGSRG